MPVPQVLHAPVPRARSPIPATPRVWAPCRLPDKGTQKLLSPPTSPSQPKAPDTHCPDLQPTTAPRNRWLTWTLVTWEGLLLGHMPPMGDRRLGTFFPQHCHSWRKGVGNPAAFTLRAEPHQLRSTHTREHQVSLIQPWGANLHTRSGLPGQAGGPAFCARLERGSDVCPLSSLNYLAEYG